MGEDENYDFDDVVIHNTSVEIENGILKYLLFDFSRKVGPNNEYERIFKAINLVKLKRIPKKDIQLASFLEMQTGVITGYYMNQVNFIQIIANIRQGEGSGLIFAYGAQGVSGTSIEEAKRECNTQLAAMQRNITGTFRTMEYVDLTAQEGRWIYKHLAGMSSMRILRGIPAPKNTPGKIITQTFTNVVNAETEEQSEEFLLGMDDYEYMLVLTATSVDPAVISKWREACMKEQTYWASIQKGQKSMSAGLSMPMVYAANMGASQGWGASSGQSFGQNYGTNYSHSVGSNQSFSEGTSHSLGIGTNQSQSLSQSQGESFGESLGVSKGYSIGQSHSVGTTEGLSSGVSHNMSQGTNFSQNIGRNYGINEGGGSSAGFNSGMSQGANSSSSHTIGGSSGNSVSNGLSANLSNSDSDSTSAGLNLGINASGTTGKTVGESYGQSGSVSSNNGASWGNSESQGTSSSYNEGSNYGNSASSGWSEGLSSGSSLGRSVSESIGTSQGASFSTNESYSNNYGESYTNSYGQSHGTSMSVSKGVSEGSSTSESVGTSRTQSYGTSETDSYGTSQGSSTGRSTGSSISGGSSYGASSSMGIGPNISYGKTFAWEDREVTYLLDLLNFSAQRIISASNNLGMWFTDVYIATENEEAAAAATSLAMSAWHNKNAMTSPLQVYKPNEVEKDYLFKHLSVFSPSVIKEGIPGQFESYKYTTMLLSNELNALTHPPRVNVGGIQTAIDDPPVLTIPGDRQSGEIFLGYVADTEKYSKKNGYQSRFKYTLRTDEIHHAYISGASRSGKTVAARRLVAETYNNVRRGEKQKRMRFVVMDPKQDWRALAKIIPPEHFRFYSLSDPTFHPIKMNLLKIPNGVYTERYADKLREIFIRSYGLGDRGFQILGKAIQAVYKRAGCYDDEIKFNKRDPLTGLYPASEKSKKITMEDVCHQLEDDMVNTKQRDKAEAIQRILDRMESFCEPLSSIYTVFCNRGEEGMGIDDLLGADDVVVLESYGMDTKTSAFIFGLITSGIYQFAVSNGGFVKPDNQYETVLVIEEANQVLISEDTDNLGGANPFEVILDQSAGYGLFIWTLTQKISDMPRSVLANSAIKLIGRQDDKDDIDRTIVQIGKEATISDRVFKNWLPDQPTGWFIIKSSRNRDFTKNAPVHVLIEYLDIEPPSNAELENILHMGSMAATQKRLTQN